MCGLKRTFRGWMHGCISRLLVSSVQFYKYCFALCISLIPTVYHPENAQAWKLSAVGSGYYLDGIPFLCTWSLFGQQQIHRMITVVITTLWYTVMHHQHAGCTQDLNNWTLVPGSTLSSSYCIFKVSPVLLMYALVSYQLPKAFQKKSHWLYWCPLIYFFTIVYTVRQEPVASACSNEATAYTYMERSSLRKW